MVRTETIYEVFIASPNDVKPERYILSDVINQIDDGHTGVSLRPVMWESDAFRDFSLPDTQSELNVLVHRCDLMVAIFGGTLGTPTDRAASGAIEEIQESNQNVLLFLKEGNVEYLRRELGSHFPKMANRLYHTYVGEGDFRKEAFRQISRWFNNRLQEFKPTDRGESQTERQEPSDSLGRGTEAVSQPTSASPESSEAVTTAHAASERVSQQPAPRRRRLKKIRGSVADLLNQGLLAAGAQIIWERAMDERYTGTVLASGNIRLPDGRTFSSPTAAAQQASGRTVGSGWERWRTEDGRTLYELRSELQFASDHQTHTTDAVLPAESVDLVSSGTGTGAVPATPVSQQPTPRRRTLKKIRGSVADLLNQGLLAAGAQIIWEPAMGERYTGTVLASGNIQLPDGRIFSNPSTAAQQASGRTGGSGWERWRTEDGRTLLYELRSELQFASDHQTHTTGAVLPAESVDLVSSGTGTGAVPATPVSQQPAPRRRRLKKIRGSVADLLNQGLLAAGAQIIWERAMGERYTATVLASGNIQLPDGRTFSNPSTAAQQASGRTGGSGWERWRTEDGRTLLYELRSELQFASDHQTHTTGAVLPAESVDLVSSGTGTGAVPATPVSQQPAPRRRRLKKIRGSVADLLNQGLLAAGAQIIWERAMGERYTATVLASGNIQLPDGRTFSSPTAAAQQASGRTGGSGWERWRTEDGRTLLYELRSELQFASDHQTHTTGAVLPAESVDLVSSGTGTGAVPATPVSQQPAPRRRRLKKIRGSVADLLNQGLLAAGAQIIWERAMGERYTATVLASGNIQLPDGRIFSNPSTAAQQASGRTGGSGWERWRTEDGRTLYELRSELQFASDHQTHTTGAVLPAESVDLVSSETGTGAVPATPVAQQPAPRRRRLKKIRGSVADLLNQGLLAAGAQIIWERAMGERYTATVLASGNIQLPDGRTFSSPTAAAQQASGRTGGSGWERWRTEDGRTLYELRSELQFASDHQTGSSRMRVE